MTSHHPPPLPPRRLPPRPPPYDAPPVIIEPSTVMPGSDIDLESDDEEQLTETQLRERYEEEEMDRFLHLFSAYVTEARMSVPSLDDLEDEDWVIPNSTPPAPPTQQPTTGIAEWAAYKLLPLLPPPQAPPPPFTLKRLRLSLTRLYLILESIYLPLLLRLLHLASWKDRTTSLVSCLLYWLAFAHSLLLPFLTIRLLLSLLRRRLTPYPTLDELKKRRGQVKRAERFSLAISRRWVASPEFGVRDVWGAWREFREGRKIKKEKSSPPSPGSKLKEKLYRHGQSSTSELLEPDTFHLSPDTHLGGTHSTPALATSSQSNVDTDTPPPLSRGVSEGDLKAMPLKEEEIDILTSGLYILNRLADIHERLKNIWLWRDAKVSIFYAFSIIILFFLSFIPITILSKLSGLVCGLFFWHIIPIFIALPPEGRARIPPPLGGAPTDAEYAMRMISQRVAQGLPIKPSRRRQRKWRGTAGDARDLSDGAMSGVESPAESSGAELRRRGKGKSRERGMSSREEDEEDGEEQKEVDWKRLGEKVRDVGERVKDVKMWGEDMKSMFKDGQWKSISSWSNANPLSTSSYSRSTTSLASGSRSGAQVEIETHTYPAQYKSPGILTLTPTHLFFTPLGASTPKLTIPLGSILGVKKGDVTKGLRVRWMCGTRGPGFERTVSQASVGGRDVGEGEEREREGEREEKFWWVGGRDELFVRLVGWEGHRLVSV